MAGTKQPHEKDTVIGEYLPPTYHTCVRHTVHYIARQAAQQAVLILKNEWMNGRTNAR